MTTECSERGYEDGKQVALTAICMCGGDTYDMALGDVADCSFFAMAFMEDNGDPMRTLAGHQGYVTGFKKGFGVGSITAQRGRRMAH